MIHENRRWRRLGEKDFSPVASDQQAVQSCGLVDSDTGYWCDTIGGSSGSPVLARSTNRVVAIHHFGTGGGASNASTMNGGARMDLIWPFVSEYLGVIFIDGFEMGDTAAWAQTVP